MPHILNLTIPPDQTPPLFHQHLNPLWPSALTLPPPPSPTSPTPNPTMPHIPTTVDSLLESNSYYTSNSDSAPAPVTNTVKARDAAGGTSVTTTTTTSSTFTATAVRWEPLSGQAYYVVNEESGSVLSLSALDARSIVGAGIRGFDEQWRVEQQKNSGGAWRLRCIGSGKFLDFEGSAECGAKLVGSKVPRNWKFDRIDEDNGVFHIYMPKTNLNVELEKGSAQPGAPVLLQDRSCGASQKWRFEPVRLSVERVGEEVVATSTITTVTKVKIVTRVRKTS
ncbi:unnamed protein product [Peniophora sp. CBMAI 1063]|nr:unnamed protein product [Peniophora sp. CBMAI 1063]